MYVISDNIGKDLAIQSSNPSFVVQLLSEEYMYKTSGISLPDKQNSLI